jgi:hypothetical protein
MKRPVPRHLIHRVLGPGPRTFTHDFYERDTADMAA